MSTPVSNAAIPATIMELIGIDERPFGRASLRSMWMNVPAAEATPPRSYIKHRAWASPNDPLHYGNLRSVVSPDWHYIETDGVSRELFDWVHDRKEQRNRVDDPAAQSALGTLLKSR